MSQEIIPAAQIAGAIIQHSDEEFDMVKMAGVSYLPTLRLCGGNSAAVKAEKIPIAHYGIFSGDDVVDAGKEVDSLVLAWQPKAVRISDDGVDSFTNPNHPEFKKIVAESAEKDSGCMFGPEFLLWLYDEKKFVAYLMGSKTARKVCPDMKQLVGRAATLKAKLIETAKYSWHGPVIVPCSSPPSVIPSDDEITAAATKFQQQPDSDTETVDKEERAR